jgi:DNA-binding transcriptional ArsR family regulator
MDEYLQMSNTFGALADPTRRALVNQLMMGPQRVTDLAKPYSLSLNAISKHLKVLERASLVRRQVKGRDHWIHFNAEPLTHAQHWVDSVLAHGAQREA